jgi:hypothetical protein
MEVASCLDVEAETADDRGHGKDRGRLRAPRSISQHDGQREAGDEQTERHQHVDGHEAAGGSPLAPAQGW